MYKAPKIKESDVKMRNTVMADTSFIEVKTTYEGTCTTSSRQVKSVGSGFATGGEQFGGGIEDW